MEKIAKGRKLYRKLHSCNLVKYNKLLKCIKLYA